MKAQWLEGKYGLWSLPLPGKFSVSVTWDSCHPKDSPEPIGYKVTFEHATLKKRFSDVASAKVAGEALAQKMLMNALAALQSEKS